MRGFPVSPAAVLTPSHPPRLVWVDFILRHQLTTPIRISKSGNSKGVTDSTTSATFYSRSRRAILIEPMHSEMEAVASVENGANVEIR